jgi:hypothetical protein
LGAGVLRVLVVSVVVCGGLRAVVSVWFSGGLRVLRKTSGMYAGVGWLLCSISEFQEFRG